MKRLLPVFSVSLLLMTGSQPAHACLPWHGALCGFGCYDYCVDDCWIDYCGYGSCSFGWQRSVCASGYPEYLSYAADSWSTDAYAVAQANAAWAAPAAQQDTFRAVMPWDGTDVTTRAIAEAAVEPPANVTLVGINSTAPPQPVSGEVADAAFNKAYHTFWRGDYAATLKLLAPALNTTDARVWYYKAFAELSQGKENTGVASLGHAVRLHLAYPADDVRTRAALERVQGSLRVRMTDAMRMAANMPSQPTASPVLLVQGK